MKITAGLGAPENLPRLAAAGADEVFAGYVPMSWLEKYADFAPMNRREVLMQPGMQLCAPGQLRLLGQMSADLGVPVALTFNSPCYLPEQYPLLAELMYSLHRMGFQDWILADVGLMLHLRNQGIPGRIHLSGEAGCFSPDALAFFRRLNISRCIFPRKITPEEMGACIAAYPDLEYEAFALNEMCHFSGAYCASLHCDGLDHMCAVPYRAAGADAPATGRQIETDPSEFGASGCAICALPRLQRAGVTHLKVVGRGNHIECMERDVAALRHALEDMGLMDAHSFAKSAKSHCNGRCYYPKFF